MLEIREWDKSLEDILTTPFEHYTAEERFEIQRIFRPIVLWREHLSLALIALSGIFVPPHERMMLDIAVRAALSNVFIGSRGTSKTSVIDVLFQTTRALLYKNRDSVILSASGFRGGQLLFTDLEKWVTGGWVDQKPGFNFIRNSMKNEKLIHRAQNFWRIEYSSLSTALTLPTNDPTKLRGIRGTELYLDEANFMDMDLVDKVAESFLNVLKDMRYGGERAEANNVFYTTTVDYAWRDFQKTARGAYEGVRQDYLAWQALKKGDLAKYLKLEVNGLHKTTYTCFDYTDTIVRRFIKTRDGRTMEVVWPDKERKWRKDRNGIPFTVRNETTGRMQLEGDPVEVIPTYGINREGLEGKIMRGETSEEIWLAEQRNVVDSSAGDVYPHAIIDKAAFRGGRYLLPWTDCGDAYKKIHKDQERHYVPEIMWDCTDPCVLGVDYAPGNRDFCAFVVIRVGPLAHGDFDPAVGLGKTSWSNVIWCEQHRNASGENVAEKIRAFTHRYNLVYFHDPFVTDTWQAARAIGLDVRGGGNAVRDELVYINKETLGPDEYRILDPLDDDERLAAFKQDTRTHKPMLDAIKPTGPLNDKLVEFTVGQFQTNALYLPADVPQSDRPGDRKFDIGYDGARVLEHQLRALQQEPTASGYRKFLMKGDEESTKNKKDFWAAFIYASKQLRAHLLRVRLTQDAPPPLGAKVANFGVGKKGIGNHAPGAKRF